MFCTQYIVWVCTLFVLEKEALHDSGTPFIWWKTVAMRSKTPKAARKSGRRVDCEDIILIASLAIDLSVVG
jgi:hypothetical protein